METKIPDEINNKIKADDDKISRIARQYLKIAHENDLSIGEMERVLEKVRAFERVHARMVFDPEIYDAWASPFDMTVMGMADFQKAMRLLG